MKLIVAIVHNEDAGALVDALLDREYRAPGWRLGRIELADLEGPVAREDAGSHPVSTCA